MSSVETNVLTITSGYVTRVTYVDSSFQITSGQPVSALPTVVGLDGTYTVSVTCGRQGSEAMADGFNQACGTPYNELAEAFWDAQPSQLNFYLAVQLDFIGQTEPVTLYLGQGSNGVHNNWWIGGSTILNSSPGKSANAFLMIERSSTFWVAMTGANGFSISMDW